MAKIAHGEDASNNKKRSSPIVVRAKRRLAEPEFLMLCRRTFSSRSVSHHLTFLRPL